MLVLLLFCLCSANFAQTQEDPNFRTVQVEGITSLTCSQSNLIPLKVKLLVEEDRNQSWVTLELNSTVLELDTTRALLILWRNSSQKYFCSAYNSIHQEQWESDRELNNLTFDPGKTEGIFCNHSDDWLSLQWSQNGSFIANVTRGETRINIRVIQRPSSISITSIVSPDLPNAEKRVKTVFLSCVLSDFQKFIQEKYWIIVVSALGYVLFCSTTTCTYMAIRRRRKEEKKRKAKARFFKVSTARNLYVDSINQEPANCNKNGMYQNFSLTKDVSCDRFSNKSSFLDVSEGGDSYLEPMSPEEADQISDDVDCYENANEEIKEGSIGSQSYEDMNGPQNELPLTPEEACEEDGDCYENANEVIKEGSIGSQSYEDMNGPKKEQSLIPEEACEEDADSYENMQTPVYSQLDRSVNSVAHSMEDGMGQTGSSMVDKSTKQQCTTELNQQNGDFYLSYQGSF